MARPIIAEIFEDLTTEVAYEVELSPVFLDLHPDITNFPNISQASDNDD